MLRPILVLLVVLVFDGCAGYRVGNTSGRISRASAASTFRRPEYQLGARSPDDRDQRHHRRFNSDGTLEVNQNANADSELDITIVNVQHTAVRSSTTDILITANTSSPSSTATYVNRKLGRKIFENYPSPAAHLLHAKQHPGRRTPGLPLAAKTSPITPSSSSPKGGKSLTRATTGGRQCNVKI